MTEQGILAHTPLGSAPSEGGVEGLTEVATAPTN